MSDRERWILYPLLFFALALGAKDQLIMFKSDTVAAPKVQCRHLEAESLDVDEITCRTFRAESPTDGKTLVEIGSTPHQTGQLILLGNDQKVDLALFSDPQTGGVFEARADDKTLVQLRATEKGGRIVVVDNSGRVYIHELPLKLVFRPHPPKTPKKSPEKKLPKEQPKQEPKGE